MKPKNLAVVTAFTLGLPTLALAQSGADTDGDGVLTFEEVQAALPEVDTDTFSAMDANGDGVLDTDEVAIAQEAGLLPPSNG